MSSFYIYAFAQERFPRLKNVLECMLYDFLKAGIQERERYILGNDRKRTTYFYKTAPPIKTTKYLEINQAGSS